VVEWWSGGVMDTGWKPMLHCFQDSRTISQSHPESYFHGPGMTGDGVIDRGRESDCSPSLRTGLAVFQRPALQLMGSTVRLRGFEVS